MSHTPRTLNVFQRILVAPGFVYAVLAYVAALGLIDLASMIRDFIERPMGAVGHPSSVAIRLVVAGVFFELRGNFVKNLLGREVAGRDARDEHLSEVCEVFGGYLTVVGLFVELADNTREVLHAVRVINPLATVSVLVLSILSMHVMYDMTRALRRGH